MSFFFLYLNNLPHKLFYVEERERDNPRGVKHAVLRVCEPACRHKETLHEMELNGQGRPYPRLLQPCSTPSSPHTQTHTHKHPRAQAPDLARSSLSLCAMCGTSCLPQGYRLGHKQFAYCKGDLAQEPCSGTSSPTGRLESEGEMQVRSLPAQTPALILASNGLCRIFGGPWPGQLTDFLYVTKLRLA